MPDGAAAAPPPPYHRRQAGATENVGIPREIHEEERAALPSVRPSTAMVDAGRFRFDCGVRLLFLAAIEFAEEGGGSGGGGGARADIERAEEERADAVHSHAKTSTCQFIMGFIGLLVRQPWAFIGL